MDLALPIPFPSPLEDALGLIRQAMDLLDQVGRTTPADFLQHAIDLIEEERWIAVGAQPVHQVRQ